MWEKRSWVRGRNLALALSLATIALLSIGSVAAASVRLANPFDPRYSLYLGEGLIQLLFCFLLWLRNFKMLWFREPDNKRRDEG